MGVVIERFLNTAQGRVMRTESPMIKVLFGSAVAEREQLKSTCFQTLALIFNVMIEKESFNHYTNATSFLLEASRISDMDTWSAFFLAIAASAKASKISDKEFVGRNEILEILCRQVLPSEGYEKLHPEAITALSSMALSKVRYLPISWLQFYIVTI